MFSPEVSDKLEYYVYRLIDPRNGDTFYVGKGQGNRVFAHANAEPETGADSDEVNDPKLQRIREIKNDGFEVAHIIHRHGMDEKTALVVEGALMEAYPGVLNKAGGHGSNEFGCMHAKQVIEQYEARETDIQHKALIIKINHTALEADSIYDAVRKSWRLNVERAEEAEYVLAVSKGLVIGVFEPKDWEEYRSNDGSPSRWGFVGEEAPDDIKKFYMRTRIPASMRKKGMAAPVLYSY